MPCVGKQVLTQTVSEDDRIWIGLYQPIVMLDSLFRVKQQRVEGKYKVLSVQPRVCGCSAVKVSHRIRRRRVAPRVKRFASRVVSQQYFTGAYDNGVVASEDADTIAQLCLDDVFFWRPSLHDGKAQ
jgi:hypothetical protein